jgi:ABC-2 type transport system permease protein
VGVASAIAYRGEFVIWILSTNMPLVMLALWSEVAREAPVGRFGEKQFVAYFLATLIVRLLTGSWVVWEMNNEIRQGELATRLLRPVHPFLAYAAENIAGVPIRGLLALPIGVLALVWAGRSELSADPVQWAIVPLAIFGAWTLIFSAKLLIGSLGLFWESSLALYDLWLGMFFVFSGYLMPLSFFPRWLRAITDWLPFRYTLAFPVETMLGLESRAESLRALGIEWAYALGLLASALVVWKRGLARYSVFGG